MATLNSYFEDFLTHIRLTASQRKELKEEHQKLRSRLAEAECVQDFYVTTFLHGSYRRGTIIRPQEECRSDVDIILVTSLDRARYPQPAKAMDRLLPFLEEHYAGKYEAKGRSFGIGLCEVDLDIVLTSAPSEIRCLEMFRASSLVTLDSLEDSLDWRYNDFWRDSAERTRLLGAQSFLYKAAQEPEWKTEPLWIPDREAKEWQQTHPLEQLKQARDKNKSSEGRYINVVKALRWWRRTKHPQPKRPKGYPLEHILWHCCPSTFPSMAQGVTETLEAVASRYAFDAACKRTPVLLDHGVPQDVLKRIDGEDFAKFHGQCAEAAKLARKAFDTADTAESAMLWRELFGEAFPLPPESDKSGGSEGGAVGGFSGRSAVSVPGSGRFG